MNARARFGAGSDARLEIILGLKIAFVGQVVYREVEIDPTPNPFGQAHAASSYLVIQAYARTAGGDCRAPLNGAVRRLLEKYKQWTQAPAK